jgi:hypothetical protein
MRSNKQSQCPTFTDHEAISLKLLQELLHHKTLGVPAPSTTKARIAKLKEIQEVPLALEKQLEDASKAIAGWLYKNKAALYSMVKSVSAKNDKMFGSGFYEPDELANILFLEGLRVLYNYRWDTNAQPLTYLISTLTRRKHVLLAGDVPYAQARDFCDEDFEDFSEDWMWNDLPI